MKLSEFFEKLGRICALSSSQRRERDITIRVHSPGSIGPSPSVEVESVHSGFDWDAGQVIIYPAQPLTTLTPEQVKAIEESVRKGQSWHAYEAYKKHRAEVEGLTTQRDELLAALELAVEQMESDTAQIESEWGCGRGLGELEGVGELPEAILEAREAIARVKGGAA